MNYFLIDLLSFFNIRGSLREMLKKRYFCDANFPDISHYRFWIHLTVLCIVVDLTLMTCATFMAITGAILKPQKHFSVLALIPEHRNVDYAHNRSEVKL